jgi:hypothetical protein
MVILYKSRNKEKRVGIVIGMECAGFEPAAIVYWNHDSPQSSLEFLKHLKVVK